MDFAFAEGGFSTPSSAGSSIVGSYSPNASAAFDTVTVTIKGNGVDYSATASAESVAALMPHGSALGATSSNSTYQTQVDGPLSITTTSTGTTLTKGPNVLGQTRAETKAKLIVNGEAHIVADDVAVAVARATPFGTSAGAGTSASVSGSGNDYSPTIVITTKGAAR